MARPRIKTDRQALGILLDLMENLGMPPTVAEFRKALKAGSNRTAQRYLSHMEDAGFIERWSGARGIRLLVDGESLCPFCGR